MAYSVGSIAFSGLPADYTVITLNDGQSGAFSEVKFGVSSGNCNSGYHFLSGSAVSGMTADGNASDYLTMYKVGSTTSTDRGYFFFDFTRDSQNNAAFKDMATGGSTPLIYEFGDAAGNVVNITLVNESSGFSVNVSGASYSRKDSAGNYSINTDNAGVDGDNIAEELKDILTAAYGASEIDLSTVTRDGNYLYVRSDAYTDGPMTFRIKRASGSWSTTTKAAAHVIKSKSTSTAVRIANVYAPDEVVYSIREVYTGASGNLTAAQFATYLKEMINYLPIGVTATVSDGTVSLTNDVESADGNVTITTTDSTNITLSGMSGGAAGGDEVAKTFINNKQIKITSALLPASAGAVDLGSTAAEWGDMFLGDAAAIKFGADQDVTLTHVADTGLLLGSSKKIQFGDSGTFIHQSADGVLTIESDTTVDINGAVVMDGALTGLTSINVAGTITGDTSLTLDTTTITTAELGVLDGITNGTGAASKALVLDASGNIASIGTVGCGAITSTGNLAVTGTITGDTSLTLDTTTITTAEIGVLDGVTAGTAAASKALVLDASKNIATIGTVGCGAITSTGSSSFGASTLASLTCTAAATFGGGYGATGVTIDTDGNIQMDGNLTVAGTTTTVDTVTMQAANAVVFEGATADAYESTLTIVDPTADHTIRLPNQSGWLPVLAAVSATAITSTPEELNIMDGGTSASSTTLDAADRLVVNDAGTMKQVALSDLEVFMEGALDTMGAQFTSATGLAAVGTIGTGVWNGTVVASAYLDADTAHLSTTQTFSGAKTFSAAAQFSNTITVGADDQGYDVILYGDTASANMTWDTSADDLILNGGAGLIVPVGQFTLGATAVSSTATELNYLDGFADAAYDQTADSVVFYDATDSKLKSESANDFTTAIAGNGLASSSGALAISWGSQRFTKALVDATSGTGSGDAANKVAITSAQLSGSEMVFLNGMLLTAEESSGSAGDFDYAITSAGVVTFESEVVDLMDADDVISIQYIVK